MADTSPARGRWAVRHVPPTSRSIVELLRAGTLDAELAAMLWVLIEGRVPVIVAAEARQVGKSTLLGALLDFLPPGIRTVELEGATETFDWLPQATELGWRRPRGGDQPAQPATPPIRPDDTVLLVPEFSDHLPSYTWGEEARIAIRAVTIGYGLAATIHADSLEEVFETLRPPPVELSDDELSRLGIVLILRAIREGVRRVIAAHYIRPTSRDEHGHVQRLGPAVLATWEPNRDRFEHFGWGVTARARAPRRAQARRLRARARSPSRVPRRPGRGRHRRRRRGARRHRRLPKHATPPAPRPSRTEVTACRPPPVPPPPPSSAPRAGGPEPSRKSFATNLLDRLATGAEMLPAVVGYEETVLPAIENAILAGHDIVFLGERGQAKTRMARLLVGLLDEWLPIVRGGELNDDPFAPISPAARAIVERDGDETADRLAAARPALRREARDAGHHDRRPDRRGGPDQGRRGPLPVATS